MAQIIQQKNVFDYSEIEILGDLERLQLVFNGIDDEDMMRRLEKRRGHGRNDYELRPLWNSLLAKMVFGHNSIESLRRELSRNAQLRSIVGFNDHSQKRHLVPPARVFTKFIKLLEAEYGSLEDVFNKTVAKLHSLFPQYGINLAGDGKYLDSYAKRPQKEKNDAAGDRREHDATFSTKDYTYTDKYGKTHTKKETHYGFRAHVVCDVATELPVAFNLTAANVDEKAEMAKLVNALPVDIRKRANSLALDRGYDSTEMIKTIKAADILPVVDIRNCWKDKEETRQYKTTDIVYDYAGNVYYCEIEKNAPILVKMIYEGYDKTKKCLRYSHREKTYKIYISYDERVFLPIARDSMKFNRLYKGRTSVERLNGRLDRDFMFEEHYIRGLNKMKTMIALSFITMNAMAISKIQSGQKHKLATLTKGVIKDAA